MFGPPKTKMGGTINPHSNEQGRVPLPEGGSVCLEKGRNCSSARERGLHKKLSNLPRSFGPGAIRLRDHA
jgi:hypothetical protein